MEQPRTLVCITHYNREKSLYNLLKNLVEQDCRIVVFDDHSDSESGKEMEAEFSALLKEYWPKIYFQVSETHRGKAGFWETYNDIFKAIKDVLDDYDYYIILPDDVEPCPDFVSKAIEAYDKAGCICLSPLLTNRSLLPGISRWGRKPIIRKDWGYLTSYFDCCTICRRDFFEALNWSMLPILPSGNPFRSSGVGRQITTRLQAAGKPMGHVRRTLLTICETDSQMNPEERKRHPMVANYEDNYACVDVHMASLYRDGHLLKTLQTLCGQSEVATIFVTLNNYSQPQYNDTMAGIKDLQKQFGCKIVTRRAKNQKGSNEKLSQLSKSTAPYIAFADDDILYPQDYFLRLIHGIRLHNGGVAFHGGILKRFPTDKYYDGGREMKSWNITVPEDTKVDIMGSGVGLIRREWFTDAELKALYADAPATSMDDIILSCVLSQKGIERWVLAHPARIIAIKQAAPDDNYVYDRYKNDDAAQVEYINEHLRK